MIHQDTCLFVGFLISGRNDLISEIASSASYRLYVNDQGPYLRKLNAGEGVYLGKFIPGITTLEALSLIEANIYSILKKISSRIPFEKYPLYLLGVYQPDAD